MESNDTTELYRIGRAEEVKNIVVVETMPRQATTETDMARSETGQDFPDAGNDDEPSNAPLDDDDYSPPAPDGTPTSSRRTTTTPTTLTTTSSLPAAGGDLRRESVRLATFAGWPLAFISPADLAAAGFFYLDVRDSCRCAFCGNYVGDWVEGDTPMTEHGQLFPMCPFVRGLHVGNLPICEEEGSASSPPAAGPPSPGHDEAGPHRNPNSGPERIVGCGGGDGDIQGVSLMEVGSPTEIEKSILKHTGPLHANYATVEARIRTFKEWPPALPQRPRELAEAGFYYIGLSDQVKCFYCDGGLRNWQEEDLPWTEHARWFSGCVFVRLVKGDEFVTRAREERPTDKTVVTTHDKSSEEEGEEEEVQVANNEEEEENKKDDKEPAKPSSEKSASPCLSPTTASPPPESSLQDENQRLKEQKTCKICLDDDVAVVFLPCGHLCACVSCAPSLRQCPVCRTKIQGTVRTYMT